MTARHNAAQRSAAAWRGTCLGKIQRHCQPPAPVQRARRARAAACRRQQAGQRPARAVLCRRRRGDDGAGTGAGVRVHGARVSWHVGCTQLQPGGPACHASQSRAHEAGVPMTSAGGSSTAPMNSATLGCRMSCAASAGSRGHEGCRAARSQQQRDRAACCRVTSSCVSRVTSSCVSRNAGSSGSGRESQAATRAPAAGPAAGPAPAGSAGPAGWLREGGWEVGRAAFSRGVLSRAAGVRAAAGGLCWQMVRRRRPALRRPARAGSPPLASRCTTQLSSPSADSEPSCLMATSVSCQRPSHTCGRVGIELGRASGMRMGCPRHGPAKHGARAHCAQHAQPNAKQPGQLHAKKAHA